jgi:Holliday junction resolvase-like predicted endonuclease
MPWHCRYGDQIMASVHTKEQNVRNEVGTVGEIDTIISVHDSTDVIVPVKTHSDILQTLLEAAKAEPSLRFNEWLSNVANVSITDNENIHAWYFESFKFPSLMAYQAFILKWG